MGSFSSRKRKARGDGSDAKESMVVVFQFQCVVSHFY